MIPQTSTIAFALIVGFIVFVTVRGELPKYIGVLTGSGSTPSSTPSATNGNAASNIANVIALAGGG